MNHRDDDKKRDATPEIGEKKRPAIDNQLFYQSMVEKYGSWEQYLETIQEKVSQQS